MKKLFVFILPFMLVVGCNDSTSEKVDIKESKVESVVSPPVVEEDMESIDTPIKDEVQEVKSEIEQEAKQEKVSGIKPETEAIPETKEKTPTASLTDTKNVESKKVYQTKQQYLQKLKEVETDYLYTKKSMKTAPNPT